MNRDDGLRIARQVKKLLQERGYPIQHVILFGSVAKNQAHDRSDIDIAVVTSPFKESQLEEGVDIHLASMDIDLRVETVTLHPEDFDRPFFTLAREIERTGVEA
ncbi:nucleotidyltransferase domain-containing protein [Candidatus Peregrinibacteria bacterium]|nr:nucleotidyltransferase domain-containing protein [Candidatus Peregrinibacteria bacterium]MBI3816042.1 nucleotidyltransferase domain-containing protein [Candidatus Peregrinibacteria bacterium]